MFNHGRMRRDFTYVDDVIEALERLIDKCAGENRCCEQAPPRPGEAVRAMADYNIGNNRTVEISRLVELLEREFGRKATIELMPMQPGDVPETCADIDDLMPRRRFPPFDADRRRRSQLSSPGIATITGDERQTITPA